MSYKTIIEDDIDILVAGAGMGGTGAAFEARYWGKNKKIVIAEKANIDRSGAVAQGLYAINCYIGARFGENNPEDHVQALCDRTGTINVGFFGYDDFFVLAPISGFKCSTRATHAGTSTRMSISSSIIVL